MIQPASQPNGMEDFDSELSKEYEKLEGTGPEPYAAYQELKEKIKLHYDVASDYYLSLWGEHIHHGYFTSTTQTKESAQVALINLLLDISSAIPPSSSPPKILDVGCGVGGTSRHLAIHHGANVTGITISSKQVEIARRLSLQESTGSKADSPALESSQAIPIGDKNGSVTFIELDAEKMGGYFAAQTNGTTNTDTNGASSSEKFDVVWISEALSHFPNKALFFANAAKVLKEGGKLVIADWFKADNLNEKQFRDDIEPIEAGMLLPPLCTQDEYVRMAETAGLKVVGGPKDISKEVAKTWDISWTLVQNPSLWAFAFSQGRDGIAFLQAFRAMRRGYANGTFRYAVMAFER